MACRVRVTHHNIRYHNTGTGAMHAPYCNAIILGAPECCEPVEIPVFSQFWEGIRSGHVKVFRQI